MSPRQRKATENLNESRSSCDRVIITDDVNFWLIRLGVNFGLISEIKVRLRKRLGLTLRVEFKIELD